MDGEIVLTQMEISPFCDKVRRVLHYKGLAYTTREVGLMELPFLKRKAPTGKVPVIEYAGKKLWDSTDICMQIEQDYPERPLLPSDPLQRADTLLLEDWADETLYFFEMTMRFAWPEQSAHWSRVIAKRDPAWVRALAPLIVPRLIKTTTGHQGTGRKDREHILRDLHRLLGALETRIDAGGFCVGGEITLADIAIASQLHCVQGSSLGAEAIEQHKSVALWKHCVDALTGAKN